MITQKITVTKTISSSIQETPWAPNDHKIPQAPKIQFKIPLKSSQSTPTKTTEVNTRILTEAVETSDNTVSPTSLKNAVARAAAMETSRAMSITSSVAAAILPCIKVNRGDPTFARFASWPCRKSKKTFTHAIVNTKYVSSVTKDKLMKRRGSAQIVLSIMIQQGSRSTDKVESIRSTKWDQARRDRLLDRIINRIQESLH